MAIQGSPENQNFYNISITLHGFFMIFFLVMPGLFGGFQENANKKVVDYKIYEFPIFLSLQNKLLK